jgi:hypothetical protein
MRRALGLVAVMLDVRLGCLGGVMRGVLVMPVSGVGVVGGGLVVALLVVVGGRAMMSRGVVVVLRCLAMMGCCFLGHSPSLAVPESGRAGGSYRANVIAV